MAINKMTFSGVGGIDLTGDTAVETDVASGKIFHKADGTQATGTAQIGGDTFADLYLNKPQATTYENLTAKNIWPGAFSYAKVQNVNLPQATFIGIYAFKSSKITSINLPQATLDVNQGAFEECSYLQEITLPKVQRLQPDCFKKCTALVRLNLPQVWLIGSNSFEGAFNNSLVEDIEFPEALTLSQNAFKTAKLKKLVTPKLTRLDGMAFDDSYIEEYTIPSTCTQIEAYTFRRCTRFKKLICENNFSSIPTYFLENCSVLEELSFIGCAQVPTLSNSSHLGIPSTCVIKVPAALETEWKQATNWVAFASQIVGV